MQDGTAHPQLAQVVQQFCTRLGEGEEGPQHLESLLEPLHDGLAALGEARLADAVPQEAVRQILHACTVLASKAPTVCKVDPEGQDVIVVGDTHGQVHDVVKMLHIVDAYKSPAHIILNGDFVDRGSWGMEVVLVFATLQLARPHRVRMLRGNHESKTCTAGYGFKAELKAKYGVRGKPKLYDGFMGFFKELPLAAVVGDTTLVVHGGLWRTPPKQKRRKRKGGTLQKPKPKPAAVVVAAPATDDGGDDEAWAPSSTDGSIDEGSIALGTLADLAQSTKGGLDPCEKVSAKNLAPDALWSDPITEPGLHLNDARGLGIVFGPDVTELFLRRNGLKLIVRSHEGPDARLHREDDMLPMDSGYTLDHDTPAGKLVTVFSAPDYPQHQADDDDRLNNRASVLRLLAGAYHTYEVITFDAARPRPHALCFYDLTLPCSDDENWAEQMQGIGGVSEDEGAGDKDAAAPAAPAAAPAPALVLPSTDAAGESAQQCSAHAQPTDEALTEGVPEAARASNHDIGAAAAFGAPGARAQKSRHSARPVPAAPAVLAAPQHRVPQQVAEAYSAVTGQTPAATSAPQQGTQAEREVLLPSARPQPPSAEQQAHACGIELPLALHAEEPAPAQAGADNSHAASVAHLTHLSSKAVQHNAAVASGSTHAPVADMHTGALAHSDELAGDRALQPGSNGAFALGNVFKSSEVATGTGATSAA